MAKAKHTYTGDMRGVYVNLRSHAWFEGYAIFLQLSFSYRQFAYILLFTANIAQQ
jgi:hypothetical protein